MYTEIFSQMKKELGQLDKWLGTAAEHAKGKSFDPNVFPTLRLAPDQFPLTRQVQICCDTVKLAASYLSGKPAESQPDTEQTVEELQARIRSIIKYLDGFSPQDFDGAAARVVSQPRWKGEWMTGADYLVQHAIPNFFFHLTTAYAILRHNGVSIGKRDYLGAQTKRPPPA
ncbi:MAG TPA: DUF1993 domain-containing protein [Steroidobacteraceae bacterium]|jgi:hypothetical protein|nr:DUF1993 domain-containing protein [Steroidobacteraceae bacterium]